MAPSAASALMSPSHTSAPGRVMIATRSHSRSTVSSTWLVMKIVPPREANCRSHCFIMPTPSGSIDSNGSSRNRISGPWIIAAANATRLRMPVLNSDSGVRPWFARSSASSSSVPRRRVVSLSSPYMRPWNDRNSCA